MNPEYIVGIKDIDEQHEEIDGLADALCAAIRDGQDGPRLQALLARFHQVLQAHFTVEEAVMARLAYPETEKHRRAHGAILDRVDELRTSAQHGDTVGLDEIEAHQIVIAHVLEHDQPFAAFVRTRHVL